MTDIFIINISLESSKIMIQRLLSLAQNYLIDVYMVFPNTVKYVYKETKIEKNGAPKFLINIISNMRYTTSVSLV